MSFKKNCLKKNNQKFVFQKNKQKFAVLQNEIKQKFGVLQNKLTKYLHACLPKIMTRNLLACLKNNNKS